MPLKCRSDRHEESGWTSKRFVPQELIISDAHHRERMTSLTQLSALDKLQKLSLTKVGRIECSDILNGCISSLHDHPRA